jgi:hypothetical protein
MSEHIAHPINENLRIKVTRDEYAGKPYDDGGFPIVRLAHDNRGWHVDQDTDLTSYVLPDRLVDGIAGLLETHGTDLVIVERYLRIFWGATFLSRYNSGSYDYLAIDPAHWREHVGVDEEIVAREDYRKHAWTEFEAWVEGNVWIATEQRYIFVRSFHQTWDLAAGHDPDTHESTDDDTTEDYQWVDTENGGVGGFYGDVDGDLQRVMMWQFGWPEAVCKRCGEGLVNDVTYGWVDYDVPFAERERRTHCVTGVMMHTRGPKHEPKES